MTAGLAGAGASAGCLWRSWADDADGRAPFNVRSFGAVADGKAVDTPAVNRAIAAVAAAGGGTVEFPAGMRSVAF
jgi:polygalacturonase